MKTKIIWIGATIVSIFLMSFIKVAPNGDLQIGSPNTAILFGKTGRFGSANNWNFNPNASWNTGLIIENGHSESSGIYLDGDYAVIWSPGDQDRLLRIYDEDYLWQGSTTYEKAYIDGDGDYFKASDARRKKDIVSVTDPVEKLRKINGVSYKYKESQAELNNPDKKEKKRHAGLLAQEVEAVIPEAVQTDEHGNKFMDYDALIPYLVEAVKAQQIQIDALKAQLASAKK